MTDLGVTLEELNVWRKPVLKPATEKLIRYKWSTKIRRLSNEFLFIIKIFSDNVCSTASVQNSRNRKPQIAVSRIGSIDHSAILSTVE